MISLTARKEMTLLLVADGTLLHKVSTTWPSQFWQQGGKGTNWHATNLCWTRKLQTFSTTALPIKLHFCDLKCCTVQHCQWMSLLPQSFLQWTSPWASMFWFGVNAFQHNNRQLLLPKWSLQKRSAVLIKHGLREDVTCAGVVNLIYGLLALPDMICKLSGECNYVGKG